MGPTKDKHQALTIRQGRHSVLGLTHRREIKEEAKAINREWVYNQACRLSLDIYVVSHSFITFNNLFKLITKIKLTNNSFKFIN